MKQPGALQRFLRDIFGIGGGAAVEADLTRAYELSESVRIRYKAYRARSTERLVDVYAIGNGYFDAYDHLRHDMRTFKIGRVRWTELTGRRFEPPTAYQPSGWVSQGTDTLRAEA